MNSSRILPGSTIGILGAGQLALMLTHAAQRLGYRTLTWSGGGDASPVRGVASEVLEASFEDPLALTYFLEQSAVITAEIEKIPSITLEKLVSSGKMRPSANAIRLTSHRRTEREFLESIQQPQTPFRLITDKNSLFEAWEAFDGNAVAKACFGGYDGRSQWRLRELKDLDLCWQEADNRDLIVEQFIPFERELSVIVARNPSGEIQVYDPAENLHRHHVLDRSIVPARIQPEVAARAQEIGRAVIQGLDYHGLMAIEFFLTRDGQLLINELAPRPHNSGHHTMNACVTSQFDQHIRAVCDLPLGSTRLHGAVVMVNLLSDQWPGDAAAAAKTELFAHSEGNFHLYSKDWNQGRRKLGHVNFVFPELDQALAAADGFQDEMLSLSTESVAKAE